MAIKRKGIIVVAGFLTVTAAAVSSHYLVADRSNSGTASAAAAVNGQQAAAAAAQSQAHAAQKAARPAEQQSIPAGQPDAVPISGPQVIRTGTVDLSVSRSRLTDVYDTASNDAAAVGGYVASSSTSGTSGDDPSATLVLRIPSASFQTVANELGALGKVVSESTNGQDVTGTVINIDARIANLTAEESALRQLINRAGTIPQILTVENQLFGVEQQIEELSGQQSSLANQVTYGTLTVNLSAIVPPVRPTPPKAPQNAFAQGARLALHNTAASLHDIAIAVGAAFPVLVVVALFLAGFGLARRRKRPAAEGAK